jgi:hypothetical protein
MKGEGCGRKIPTVSYFRLKKQNTPVWVTASTAEIGTLDLLNIK